jgi:anti-sigma factor RsiW
MISPPIRRWVRRFLQKHPKMAAQYKKWRDRGRAKRQKLIKKRRALARKLHLKHEQ